MYRIMIVEDEPPIARYLCRLMEQWKGEYEVAAVGNNGEEGLHLFLEHRPDIVITDVRMPRMNGLELIEKIKAVDPRVQFLIISDYQDFEYARDGLRLGVHNYLIKPVTTEQLGENLKQLKGIFEKERKKDGNQILRELIHGNAEREAVRWLQKQAAKWQLILFQHGCVMNSRMNYLIRPEENSAAGFRNLDQMVAFPEHAAAWIAQNDSNIMICLWNAETVSFQEEYFLYGHKEMAWTVACSDIFEDLEKIPLLYSNLSRLLYYRTVIGRNQFFSYREFQNPEYQYAISLKQEQGIIQAMKMNNFDLLKNELIYLFAELERESIPQYSLENLLQNIFFMLSEKRKITMEQQQEGIAEIIYCSKTMSDVLGGVLDLLMTGWEIGEENAGNRNKGQQMMESIDQYIHTHLNEVFSLQDLSDTFYLSKTYICRLFRDYKGMSFKDYILGIKIDQAKKLLEKGESVRNVSEYLGYMDQFYFSKVFKKRTGVSPSEFVGSCKGIGKKLS